MHSSSVCSSKGVAFGSVKGEHGAAQREDHSRVYRRVSAASVRWTVEERRAVEASNGSMGSAASSRNTVSIVHTARVQRAV